MALAGRVIALLVVIECSGDVRAYFVQHGLVGFDERLHHVRIPLSVVGCSIWSYAMTCKEEGVSFLALDLCAEFGVLCWACFWVHDTNCS